MQLRKLIVHVENVLRGAPIAEIINVYYFTFAGGFDGPRPLGFWSMDAAAFYGSDPMLGCCGLSAMVGILVRNGLALVDILITNQIPQNRSITPFVDILCTRGEGKVDEDSFGTELEEQGDQVPGLQEYSIAKLRHLALTEPGYIRSRACQALWIYTVDLVKPNIKSDAMNAMKAANCD